MAHLEGAGSGRLVGDFALSAKSLRFRALDGFRGFCALLVALYHWPVVSHLTGPRYFLPNAQMMMDFFFVFSGFIIAGSYGDRLDNWTDLRAFVARRFARLWPLHAAVLAAFVVIELAKALIAPHAGIRPPFTGAHSPGAIVSNLLMVQSLHVHDMLTWNAPSWTVSVEFYTYLLFGGLTVLAARWRDVWSLALACMGFIGIVCVARQLAATYDFGLFRCFCGVLTWRLWNAEIFKPRWSARVATVVETFSLVGVFAYIALLGGDPGGYAGPLIFSLFVWLWAWENGQVTALLARSAFVRLGEISYSIYLTHYLIIVVAGLLLRAIGIMAHIDYAAHGVSGVETVNFIRFRAFWFADAVTAIYLGVVVVFAGCTYRWIEQPSRKLFSRKFFGQGASARQPRGEALPLGQG
jgi:peptidoglycan/LPS O-acetylase OafA/YrhL